MSVPTEVIPERSSRITARDRRGLGEIVAFASMTMCLTIVIAVQAFIDHHVSEALIGSLVALVLVLAGRGTQSSMERGGASEALNREADRYRLLAEQAQTQNARLSEALTQALVRASATPPVAPSVTVIAQPAAPTAVEKE